MRIHVDSRDITADRIIVTEKEKVHYLKDVLRLKASDVITVFDEKGNEYKTRLEHVSSKSLFLGIEERLAGRQGQELHLTVACAIPKKSKFDDIIDKLTQLGVDRIIPLVTQRVIVKIDREKAEERRQRWEKIATAASQQSQRNTVPVLDPIRSFKSVISEAKNFDLKLIPTLPGERMSLKEVLKDKYTKILVLIGPEGDFTPEEVLLAVKAGFIPIYLGDLVLRVETAAIAVASLIKIGS